MDPPWSSCHDKPAIPAAGETTREEERLESEVDASTRTGCCTGSQQANAKANNSVQRDRGDYVPSISGSAASIRYSNIAAR